MFLFICESISLFVSFSDLDFMKTLPELIVEDFDAEQVWAGVDLQNKAKFPKLVDKFEHLLQLTRNNGALHHLSDKTNEIKSKNSKKYGFNLIIGTLPEEENIENDELYDQEDDLHEIQLDTSYKDAKKIQQGK